MGASVQELELNCRIFLKNERKYINLSVKSLRTVATHAGVVSAMKAAESVKAIRMPYWGKS